MIDYSLILGLVMVVALNLYVLTGGADFGGGIWELFATGETEEQQKKLIASALSPIWEANHVWLILVVVILFSSFPPAFAALCIVLHIPLTLLLLGIVARGAAFIFRSYDTKRDDVQRRWGRVFAISSVITPILLGIIVGAVSSGDFATPSRNFYNTYIHTWITPFCLSVGIFALTVFAFLAATYLTVYAHTDELKSAFRKRALIAQALCGTMAVAVYFIAEDTAKLLRFHLTESTWSTALFVSTAVFASACTFALIKRKYHFARVLAGMQVSLILWGWALSQFPHLIRPEFTLTNCSAPRITLELLIWALGAGAFLLFPSFFLLYKVFHAHEAKD